MIDTGDARIRLSEEGHLAVITIARPEKLNALDYDMVLALERAAHQIDTERACSSCHHHRRWRKVLLCRR